MNSASPLHSEMGNDLPGICKGFYLKSAWMGFLWRAKRKAPRAENMVLS